MHGSLGLCECVSCNQATRVLGEGGRPLLPGRCLLGVGALRQLPPIHLSIHSPACPSSCPPCPSHGHSPAQ